MGYVAVTRVTNERELGAAATGHAGNGQESGFRQPVEALSLNRGEAPQLFGHEGILAEIDMVITMPIFGYWLDRLPTRPMFAGALLLMSASLLSLAWVTDVSSMIVFSAVFGLANAGFQSHYSFMWPRYFGRRHLGSIQGAAQTIGVVGASLGPLPLGLAFDLFGSYTQALYMLAALPVTCAFMLLFLRPPNLGLGSC